MAGAVDVAALGLRIESIGLAEANRALDALEKGGLKAAGGLTSAEGSSKKLQGTLRGVAFNLAQLPGPIGKITASLAEWGAGGGLAIGIGAAFAAAAFAVRELNKDTAAWVKTLNEARAAAQKLAPDTAAIVQSGVIETEIDRLKVVKQRLEAGPQILGVEKKIAEVADEIAKMERESAALKKKSDDDHLAAIEKEVAKQEKIVAINRELSNTWSEYFESVRRDNLELASRGDKGMPVLMANGFNTHGTLRNVYESTGLFQTTLRGPGAGPGAGGALLEGLSRSQANFGIVVRSVGKTFEVARTSAELYEIAVKRTAAAQQQAATVISAVANGIVLAINALKGNGSFWSFLSGVGMTVGSALAISNPLVGAAVVGGSSIIGALAQPSTPSTTAAAAVPSPAPTVGPNLFIGPEDPTAQRQVLTTVRRALQRGGSLS